MKYLQLVGEYTIPLSIIRFYYDKLRVNEENKSAKLSETFHGNGRN